MIVVYVVQSTKRYGLNKYMAEWKLWDSLFDCNATKWVLDRIKLPLHRIHSNSNRTEDRSWVVTGIYILKCQRTNLFHTNKQVLLQTC